jgi:hypothetical protein
MGTEILERYKPSELTQEGRKQNPFLKISLNEVKNRPTEKSPG